VISSHSNFDATLTRSRAHGGRLDDDLAERVVQFVLDTDDGIDDDSQWVFRRLREDSRSFGNQRTCRQPIASQRSRNSRACSRFHSSVTGSGHDESFTTTVRVLGSTQMN
jgi:hypothetical protein